MDVEEKKDIFDKLMHLPVLNIFEPFYKKHKEVLMYLFFGGLTFFLNIALYAWLDKGLGMNALIANVICWVVCVLFQYFTNRTWVFDGQVDSAAGFLKQMASFFGGRLFTLIVEEAILAVFITWLGFNSMAVKLVAQVVVIVLNYVISKLIKDKTNDMTVGNPVSLIIRFMIPMCLGNIFQQFYNIADSIVAGQFLGVDALAAIGSTGSLMFFVTGWLNGLSSGFAILVSQWFGAKQYDKMRHYVAMSIYLAAAFAIVMTIGFEALNEPILRLMNSPEDLMGSVKGYMGIIYAGLIVTAAYNSLAAFLRALGDSKSPLYFLIISAVINVFLDILFIVKIGMGVEGCAYATVIAQAISAVCCLIYIIKKFPILHLKKENFEVSFTSFRYLLALGIPMGLQFSITAIGTIIVQGAVNIYGSVYMAGFSAAGKIQNIIATVFVAFGATMATYVGQNRGAGKMDRVKAGMKYTQIMVLIWSVITMIIMFFFGKYMTWLFIDKSQTDVINVSVTYFHTVFWAYPFLGSIFLYRNGLQGLGYGLVPMLGGVFELAARSAIVMFIAGKTSFAGVCLADPAAWIAALIPLIPYYIYVMKKWSRGKKETAA